MFLHPHEFVDHFDHVDRDADGAGLVGDGTGDGLANPPSGVSGKLVAAAVFKFFNRFHQAHVAFLNKVQKGKSAVGVFFGDGDDQAQIGFHHFRLGLDGFAGEMLQFHVSLEVLLAGHAHEFLQGLDLALL